ncbi:MAG: MCE family protein [Polyangiaceae bacterium]|nr:MCE family protein [Polyangiaceae bacterium]
MAATTNHWKLGLFVVAGLAMALFALVTIGARSLRPEVAKYESYFDESVEGLEVGSPIKFRGVTIGTVGKIQVAPNRRHVEVECELGVKELARLGLDLPQKPALFGVHLKRRLAMAPDLRVQLASSGLTGAKFLQLDFFDVGRYPPPELPFEVPNNYIPTAPSMMKSLEDSILLIAERLPELTDQLSSIAGAVNVIVRDVDDHQIPTRIVSTLDMLDGLLATSQKVIGEVDARGLSRNANTTLASVTGVANRLDAVIGRIDQDDGLLTSVELASDNANRTLNSVTGVATRLDSVIGHVDQDGGLLTSVQAASDAVGGALRDADGLGGELVDTLESLRTSARSLRKLTEALEQDPEMLVKGRKPERKKR